MRVKERERERESKQNGDIPTLRSREHQANRNRGEVRVKERGRERESKQNGDSVREIASERATERYYLETETDMERERERKRERERHRTCVTERHIDRDIYREKQRGNWRDRERGGVGGVKDTSLCMKCNGGKYRDC